MREKLFTIRMTEEETALLNRVADHHHRTAADLIRGWVRDEAEKLWPAFSLGAAHFGVLGALAKAKTPLRPTMIKKRLRDPLPKEQSILRVIGELVENGYVIGDEEITLAEKGRTQVDNMRKWAAELRAFEGAKE